MLKLNKNTHKTPQTDQILSTGVITIRQINLIAGTTISAPCVSGSFILMEKTFMCGDKKSSNVYKNNNAH